MDSIVQALVSIIYLFINFINFFYETVMYVLGYITGLLMSLLLSFQAFLIDFYEEIISTSINFSYELYQLAKIPELITLFNSFNSNSDFCYYSDYFMISPYFIAVISAYLIRFGIRRLPIIG